MTERCFFSHYRKRLATVSKTRVHFFCEMRGCPFGRLGGLPGGGPGGTGPDFFGAGG